MDLEENKISLTAVRQYLKLLISNVDVFTRLEFKTLRGWMLYSLSLVFALCFPCVIIFYYRTLIGEYRIRIISNSISDSFYVYFALDVTAYFYL